MLVPIGSNNSAVWMQESMVNFRGMKEIPTEEASPEKAGVGGSIPSLATMFSTTYRSSQEAFHSVSFQNFGLLRFASRMKLGMGTSLRGSVAT